MSHTDKSITIISGASGTGKGVVIRCLMQEIPFGMPVSATTRMPRSGELEGHAAKPYLFLTKEEFEAKIQAGEFAEWAQYGGEYYGTLLSEILRIRSAGLRVLIECEVNGARNLKRAFPDALWIFIRPPGGTEEDMLDVLQRRLTGRRTDPPTDIERRLEIAIGELRARGEADVVIVNHNSGARRAARQIARRIAEHEASAEPQA